MQAPNAEQIEGATDELHMLNGFVRDSQMKELQSAMGAPALEKLGSTYPLTEDFKIGYALGIQTARRVIAQSVAINVKGVNPDDVL